MAYCWKCGAQLYDNSSFCHGCGAPAKPSPTMASGGQTGFDHLKDDKAFQDHWVKRVIAYVVDVAIVSVAVYFLLLVTALPALLALFFGQTFPFAWFWGFWLGGIAPLVVLAYFVMAEALFERTIGKELMGLRVARLDGKRVDLWSSLVRNVSKIAVILLVLDVAAGLGSHGDGAQKYSDHDIARTAATSNMNAV